MYNDIDDYINSIVKENESLKNTVESLKNEIRTQRKEISVLTEERRTILNNEKGLNNIIWKENNNND